MKTKILSWRSFLIAASCCVLVTLPAYGQLNSVFSNIFTEILDVQLQRSGSPLVHRTHFLLSAARANNELVPALNGLISGNVSSFPLSSTSAGVLFDFSTGQPVRIAESLGPILAETAKPLGRGKFLIEANFTYLDLNRFRGLATDQMRFTFTHEDVGVAGLGDSPNESDLIDLVMDLHTRVSYGAVLATVGVTNDLDVSVALPIISVRMNGTAKATISSFTFAAIDSANHIFGGTPHNPVLETNVPYDNSATGLGDIALRVKYNISRGGAVDIASLLDVRFPTGKKENFFGSGKATYRIWGILSSRVGDLTPHLNLGYTSKPADYQSDALEFRVGFDNKLSPKLTFACDVLGQIDLQASEAVHLAPGSVTIVDQRPGGQSPHVVNLSNIPDRNNDNAYSVAVGFRYAPSDPLIFYGNFLIPLNDGGLRGQIAPTVGVSMSL